jgi:hypothetical protein
MLPALRDIDLLHIELRNKDNEDVRALLKEIERLKEAVRSLHGARFL